MKSIREMQSQIGKQLEELKRGIENSKGKGSKPMSGGGDMKLNEQVARMAAQQEALRNALAKQMEESSGGGLKNNENLNRALKSMDETERDILNKKYLLKQLGDSKKLFPDCWSRRRRSKKESMICSGCQRNQKTLKMVTLMSFPSIIRH